MSTSSAPSLVNEEDVILEAGDVELFSGDNEPEGTRKLTVTNRFLNFENDEALWQIFYSAVLNFGVDEDGSTYPQPCVFLSIDVNKEPNCIIGGLRDYTISKHAAASDGEIVLPVDDEGNTDCSQYLDPCCTEVTFYPTDAEQCSLESIYNAISEAMSMYKSSDDADEGDDNDDVAADNDDVAADNDDVAADNDDDD